MTNRNDAWDLALASRHRPFLRRSTATAIAALLVHAAAFGQTPPPTPAGETQSRAQKLQHLVFGAFPEADAYRAVKRTVSQSNRQEIERLLPFKVHFNELGKHELLVAFRGRRPVGLVYCRTEEAEWGLVEIAWHVSLEQRIVGFEYLRGRNRHIQGLRRSQLATDLGGSGLTQVAALITAHNQKVHVGREASLVSIERTTLRSAAKVLAVITTVWPDQVETLCDQAHGFDLFPTAARFTRRTTEFQLHSDGIEQPIAIKVLYAYDNDATFLGCIVWTRGTDGIAEHALRWAIDRNMRILVSQPTDSPRDSQLRKACNEIKGHSVQEAPSEALALSPLAAVLGVVIPALEKGRSR